MSGQRLEICLICNQHHSVAINRWASRPILYQNAVRKLRCLAVM